MNLDFSILYAIQNIRSEALDRFILALTNVMGSNGQIWLYIGAALLIFRKTRKCGIAVLLSYGLVFVIGQCGLKDWIARQRPCHIDTAVEMLVKRPSSYSCPSTHSSWAFAAAGAVLFHNRKWGAGALAVAALIGFSRLYLFVHFPTDVLFGAVLGLLLGLAAGKLVDIAAKKIASKHVAGA